MEKIIDLRDLLKHEIMDLYSAEEQIIEALPKMVEKANNPSLKNALSNHLRVTEEQKKRLDEVQRLLGTGNSENGEDGTGEMKGERRTGFFARLFGGSSGSGGEKCRGTEGLIEEGEKMMAEDMTPEAMDSAIIASAQKIEHYEISGYGTARAFARELNLGEVANLLEQTLNEEYQADDQLTQLAVGRVNAQAEMATDDSAKSSGKKSKGASAKANKSASASKSRSKGSSKGGSKGSSSKGSSKSNSAKSSSRSSSKSSKGGSSKGSSSKSSKSSTKSSSKSPSSSRNKSGSKPGKGSSSNKKSSGKTKSLRRRL